MDQKLKIVCFGDSNTYGYDAASFWGDRLPAESRWPDIFAVDTQHIVKNYGENGREIPISDWDYDDVNEMLRREAPFDILLIMLGSNDLLNTGRPSAARVLTRMEQFIQYLTAQPALSGAAAPRIVLLTPPPSDIRRLVGSDDRFAEAFEHETALVASGYASLTDKYNLYFIDTSHWDITLAADGVHISPAGHRAFARELEDALRRLELI